MTIVRHTLVDAAGKAIAYSNVVIRLATNAYVTATQSEIESSVVVVSDATGLVSIDLTPQSQLDPLGTHYEWTNPGGEVLSFTVPGGAGPFWLRDILVSNPATPPAITAGVPLPATPLQPGQFYGVGQDGMTGALGVELAYAENVTGTATVLGTAAVPLGCVISIAPTSQIVWLRWTFDIQVTAAAGGGVFAQVYDITNGTPGTLVISSGLPVTAANGGVWSKFLTIPMKPYRIGPVAATRVFSLSGVLASDTSGLGASARNSASAPTYLSAVGL